MFDKVDFTKIIFLVFKVAAKQEESGSETKKLLYYTLENTAVTSTCHSNCSSIASTKIKAPANKHCR